MDPLRVAVISPGDVAQERQVAEAVVLRETGVKPFLHEAFIAPIVGTGPIQPLIDRKARLEESHVVIAIFGRRVGTQIEAEAATGTQHELGIALKAARIYGLPKVMIYFRAGTLESSDAGALRQFAALLEFRAGLRLAPAEFAEYVDVPDFRSKLADHFRIVRTLAEKERDRFAATEVRFMSQVTEPEPTKHSASVDGHGRLYSSFNPKGREKPFIRFKAPTSTGRVPDREHPDDRSRDCPQPHKIYVIRDPIRPFEIQIGEFRANRFGKEPNEVPFEGLPSTPELLRLYPLIQESDHRWLRIVLAELVNDERALRGMHTHEKLPEIKNLIARNPSAPNDVRQGHCKFCNGQFQAMRTIDQEGETVMIPNDYPFGPFFHYLVFPKGTVHSWDSVTYEILSEMNHLVWRHFRDGSSRLCGAAGVRVGFNSSVRHLVLGHKTRASAGASIAHVHKQIWGMAPGSVNVANTLNELCLVYDKAGLDYLERYLEAIEAAGLKVWEDENVVLYVPFGQISQDELQIIVKRNDTASVLALTEPEIYSLSKAEFAVTRIFDRLEINSFNEVVLALPEDTKHSGSFRLIWTFITREIDLAVSELNLLYVVDRHPYNTVQKVDVIWPGTAQSRRISDLIGNRNAAARA
ncbi:MAG TPA: hypothetical protein VE959_37800 [Bryobacteraceae bacterium]|nr:hypothetical protein [Bryobacteraceae bacterium]